MDTNPDTSTIPRELLAGAIGVAVAIGCVLPPLVHFVTGPLGAFIGGFVANQQCKPGTRGRAIIAATIGGGLSGLAAAVAFAIDHFSNKVPDWFPSSDALSLIFAGIFVYGAALAAAGTAASTVMLGRRAAAQSAAEPEPGASGGAS